MMKRAVVAGQVLIIIPGHFGIGGLGAVGQRSHLLVTVDRHRVALLDLDLLAAHRALVGHAGHGALLRSSFCVLSILPPRPPALKPPKLSSHPFPSETTSKNEAEGCHRSEHKR